MKKYFSFLFIIVPVLGIFAQFEPGEGSRLYFQYISPQYIGRSPSAARADSVFDAIVNPALSAKVQRIHLQASYSALIDGTPEISGHAVNFGVGIPSPVGVFFVSGHYLNADSSDVALNNSGSFHFAFSKAITDRFWFGTGVQAHVGGPDSKNLDWGLGADLGIAYTIPLQRIPYIRIGLGLRNLGKWLDVSDTVSGMPEPFSLVFGTEFMFLDRNNVQLALNTDITLPSFLGLRTDLAFLIRMFDIVELSTAWQFDLDTVLDRAPPVRSLFPSFGITFRIPLAKKANVRNVNRRPQIDIRTAAMPLNNQHWLSGVETVIAFGQVDRNAPEVDIVFDTPHISPNHDGTQDYLSVDIAITDERYVKTYRMDIYDEQGKLVRTIANPEDRIENQVRNFFTRLVAADKGIDIPPQLLWDGVGEDGSDLPSGEYYFRILSEDDNKNIFESKDYVFTIDREPPELEVEQQKGSSLIFSPNGDQKRDTLTIGQSGSPEASWRASITSADGRVVRTYAMQDSKLTDIVWDGRDNDNVTVPDGVYYYKVQGTDLAGNSTQGTLNNIIVRTDATPAALRINRQFFSPNNDGVADSIVFTPEIGNREGIVRWELSISDENEQVLRAYEGTSVPEEFSFDGRTQDGSILPDGSYSATLVVYYVHGNRPQASSPVFSVDTVAPQASVRGSEQILSPNGDGVKDEIQFIQSSSNEIRWSAVIANTSGANVYQKLWSGSVPASHVWDGRLQNGRIAPDGDYSYTLSSEDRGGNKSSVVPVAFSIDTSSAELLFSPEFAEFSPNNDKQQDVETFYIKLANDNKSIDSYDFTIWNAAGAKVFTMSGRDVLPENIIWNGINNQEELAPDGSYRVHISITLKNGIIVESSIPEIVIDTRLPSASVQTDTTVFSPDGDNLKDSINFTQSSSFENEWIAEIKNEDGTVVQSFIWSDTSLDSFSWDGKDESGNILPDGYYTYTAAAADAAGNRFNSEAIRLRLDTRPASVLLIADRHAISTGDDITKHQITFNAFVDYTSDVARWDFVIRDSNNQVYYQESGETVEEEMSFTWHGNDNQGTVMEGEYLAEFSILYDRGTNPSFFSPPLLVDFSPPNTNITMSPLPFSPDNDGVNDVLRIQLNVEDVSDIAMWRLDILDRSNILFNSFEGTGPPSAELLWDGRSHDGDLVISAEDYPYIFTIRDVLENEAVVSGEIPIDVLVIRDGDALRVRISSIYFEPNSPELFLDEADPRGIKNKEVLGRLVEVFDKYSNYRILIEGHAVNITGTQDEEVNELAQLSAARAVSVQAALAERGINYNRLSVAGRGGTDPIVPHTDLDNRWKNRRVEFILLK